MTDQELLHRAERVEVIDGEPKMVIPVSNLTADEFAELIMCEVRQLQEQRQEAHDSCLIREQ